MTEAVIETTNAPAAAPAAAPTPAPAPAASAPASAPAEAPAPAASAPAAAPAAAPAPADAPDWRARALKEVFGDEADDAPTETKAEREKLAKLVGRYNTTGDMAKALREAQKRISSGELKASLPKDAKPEQIAEWRKENGIPETPDKYEIKLPEGVEIDDRSKPIVNSFIKDLHAINATPEFVSAAVSSMMLQQEAVIQATEEADATARKGAEDELRELWGKDYRTNVDGIGSLLGQFESGAREALETARDANGVSIMNNPAVLRALAGHARELGYVGATVVPAGGDLGKGIEDEIKSIEKSMFNEDGTKSQAYWGSQKTQDRYAQLLDTQRRRENK